jgi:hypothetical protein
VYRNSCFVQELLTTVLQRQALVGVVEVEVTAELLQWVTAVEEAGMRGSWDGISLPPLVYAGPPLLSFLVSSSANSFQCCSQASEREPGPADRLFHGWLRQCALIICVLSVCNL